MSTLRFPLRRHLLPLLLIAASPAAAQSGTDTVARIVADYEALSEQSDPSRVSGWPDVSSAADARRLETLRALRARLGALPSAPAAEDEQLTARLLAWRLDTAIEAARFDEARIPFDNGDGFFNTANYAAGTTVIRDAAGAEAWIARLRALPGFYDQQIENLRRGIATGFTAPRPTAQSVLAILRIAADQPVEDSPLLAPLRTMPPIIDAALREALMRQATDAVATAVKPAQRDLVAFFETEYLPAARPALAAATLPDGRAYYAFAARRATTTPLTPDEIFALGETEVAQLRAEMEAQMRRTGFSGTLPEFLRYLRTERRFYAPDLATYIEKASEIGKRVDYALPRWFGTLPRLPWGIRQKPPEMEASSGGYNLGDPEKGVSGAVVVGSRSFEDPLFGLPAWMLHEGVPGHHLQIAIGQERFDIPPFRRRDDITAFVEGWALYAELLGEEMGIYRDAYERFGRLSFAMWRACRLVMDVGIHWKGWSRQQAEACLRENTALPERVVTGETQRYIAWPGQALAYKVGERTIRTLRARAEQRLGSSFDIRAFHDLVLGEGAMPLSILEERVDAWIAAGGTSARAVVH